VYKISYVAIRTKAYWVQKKAYSKNN